MYDLTLLFFSRPLFMLELLIGEYMFAHSLPRRKHFPLRVVCVLLVCFGISFALPNVIDNKWYGWSLFIALFLVTLAALPIVYRCSFKNVLFCAIAGFTVQHIASEVFELFNLVAGLNGEIVSDFYGNVAGFGGTTSSDPGPDKSWLAATIYVNIFFLCYCAAYWLFARKAEKYGVMQLNSRTILGISVLFVFLNVVFSGVIIWVLPSSADRISVGMLHIYNIISCILALVILFELPRRKSAENELFLVRQIQQREREQYVTAKENIELINIKCHDLKHQIRNASFGQTANRRELAEIEKLIDIYDSAYQTSNEALNVILMEKSLVCKNNSIIFSCIIGADGLRFMSDTDIYSLFGNMIDNAIEAVKHFEPGKRTIGLSVKNVKNFVVVNIYNRFEGDLSFENGLPLTTKQNRPFHGYGLKSIRNIVEKYNGNMRISTDNHVFSLTIVFLIPPEGNEKSA